MQTPDGHASTTLDGDNRDPFVPLTHRQSASSLSLCLAEFRSSTLQSQMILKIANKIHWSTNLQFSIGMIYSSVS